MMQTVSDIRAHFISELANGNFTTDKTGMKTIELLSSSFIADQPAIFGTPSQEYIDAELAWYYKMSLNINDIHDGREPPQAWQYAANEYGEINSNYGHIVFSDKYHNQYRQALDELIKNPDSRRAQMIYNRPSMWLEYNEDGKNDFVCTNAQTFYIRDGKLHMVSQMRSNDVVFGYKNDYAWAQHLMDSMVSDLHDNKIFLEKGTLFWQVMNLHVYERHFHLVK
jgi:thymidylate synthase